MNHQTKDYPKLIDKLNSALTSAIDNQEYHRLMDLDSAVKACVSEAVAHAVSNSDKSEGSNNNTANNANLAEKIEALKVTYQKGVMLCSDKSRQLQSELSKMSQSKMGAQNYLQVARRS